MTENMEDRSRIYAVTNRKLCRRPFPEQIERVCVWKPGALILREKDLPVEAYRRLAREVSGICEKNNVPCILHTFYTVAAELGIPEIHLPLPLLRNMPEDEKNSFARIGCSVHSVQEALEAQRLGASYLVAGHIYATDCKRGVLPRGTEFLRQICGAVKLPVYGIGGIGLGGGRMEEVTACGAAGACIMSGMMEL